MFLWASLARYAKHAKLIRVLCVFFAVQGLLTIPVGISMLRDPPDVFYPRIHGGPVFEHFDSLWTDYIRVTEDERGFVSAVTVLLAPGTPFVFDSTDENGNVYRVITAGDYDVPDHEEQRDCDFLFSITPQYVFFRDSYSNLVIPTDMISAWTLEEGDLRELFNHLALYNSYFSSIVAPVFLLVFVVMLAAQAVILLAAVWFFGQWVKLSGTMTFRERFYVCTFASVPAGLIGFAVGLLVPVIHVFIAQLLMIYFSYKAMKEYLGG